jgi:uncharacterized integral membrane protein
MIALALVCLLLAAALVIFVLLAAGTGTVAFTFFAGTVQVRPIWLFAAGALAMFLVLTGLDFFRRGTRRKVAQRREIKRLRQVEQTSTTPADDGR